MRTCFTALCILYVCGLCALHQSYASYICLAACEILCPSRIRCVKNYASKFWCYAWQIYFLPHEVTTLCVGKYHCLTASCKDHVSACCMPLCMSLRLAHTQIFLKGFLCLWCSWPVSYQIYLVTKIYAVCSYSGRLPRQKFLALRIEILGETGIEPATSWSGISHSTAELHAHTFHCGSFTHTTYAPYIMSTCLPHEWYAWKFLRFWMIFAALYVYTIYIWGDDFWGCCQKFPTLVLTHCNLSDSMAEWLRRQIRNLVGVCPRGFESLCCRCTVVCVRISAYRTCLDGRVV